MALCMVLLVVLMRLCGLSNAVLWFFLAAFPVFFMWFCGCCVAGVCGCSSYGLRLGKKIRNGIFFTFKVWLILKRLLPLYCIQKHISMYLTDREKELVEALRNYRRAYPNWARNLEIYIL